MGLRLLHNTPSKKDSFLPGFGSLDILVAEFDPKQTNF